MMIDDWRARLKDAVEASGRSKRDLSLSIPMAHVYVRELLNGKDPTLEPFMKLCQQLNVSPTYILTGIEMTPEEETVLQTFSRLKPDQRTGFLQLLRTMVPAQEGRQSGPVPPAPQD